MNSDLEEERRPLSSWLGRSEWWWWLMLFPAGWVPDRSFLPWRPHPSSPGPAPPGPSPHPQSGARGYQEGGKEKGREKKLQDEMQVGSGAHCSKPDLSPPPPPRPTPWPGSQDLPSSQGPHCRRMLKAHCGLLAASEHFVMLSCLVPTSPFSEVSFTERPSRRGGRGGRLKELALSDESGRALLAPGGLPQPNSESFTAVLFPLGEKTPN